MKKKIIIIGNGFASLFFIQYFLALPFFPFFAGFFRRLYSRHDITLIGNGNALPSAQKWTVVKVAAPSTANRYAHALQVPNEQRR